MFGGCSSLTTLDLSNWNTSKVTTWGRGFSANKLTNIGLVYASSSTINSIVTNGWELLLLEMFIIWMQNHRN